MEFKLPVISFSYNALVVILNKLNYYLWNVTIIKYIKNMVKQLSHII